jgi:hypothetical protein
MIFGAELVLVDVIALPAPAVALRPGLGEIWRIDVVERVYLVECV